MMDFFKKIFSHEPVKRAIRTFIQATAGYIAVHIAVSDFESEHAIKALCAAAVAAGIAAVMNADINHIN